MRSPRVCTFGLAMLVIWGANRAEEPPAPDARKIAERVAQRASENLSRLRGRAWTTRTEIRSKNKLHTTRVETVRVGADGRMQRTLVSEQGPKRKVGPSGERQQYRIEKLHEQVARLVERLESYAVSERPAAAASSAEWRVGSVGVTGVIRVWASGVLQPDDRVTLWVSPDSTEVRSCHVFTRVDEDDVVLETEYRRLEDGLIYPARRTIRVAARRLEVKIENSGFAAPP